MSDYGQAEAGNERNEFQPGGAVHAMLRFLVVTPASFAL